MYGSFYNHVNVAMSKKKRYAIVDLETTGGMSKRDKITEIAIVILEDNRIIDTFSSLINPNRSIPQHITRITGITDDMVAVAPQFFEVAKKVVEMTEGAVFVAHNVRFDYSFLKEEFAALGYTFSKKQLCTVRLSRKAFPGLKSYALGNLIKHFDIPVNARHRALDDATATAIILQKILNQDYGEYTAQEIINKGIKSSRLPQSINIDRLHALPEAAGVYYFYNTYNSVIYVGKSINIKKRIMQHFSATTKKADKLQRMAHDLSFQLTGNELIAMLLESFEIKALQPEINKVQKTAEYPYFVYTWIGTDGYQKFGWEKSSIKTRKGKNILSYYGTKQSALSHLAGITRELTLCQSYTSLYDREGPCFSYKTENCYGACIKEESPADYNSRAQYGVELLKRIFDQNFILILNGRTPDEKSVVLVEEGHYKGFGYIDNEGVQYGIEELKEAINYVPINPEANGIIRTYLQKHPFTKRITF